MFYWEFYHVYLYFLLQDRRTQNGARMIESLENVVMQSAKVINDSFIQNENVGKRE